MRLNKFLAEKYGISRREADEAVMKGEVVLNGLLATIGARAEMGDEVIFRGKKAIINKTDYIYLMLNKPVGYVCSRKSQDNVPTIYELLPKKYQSLKTVGRLDKNSSGLILLTNDGDFAFLHTHPKFFKLKTYLVELDHALEPLHQQEISDFGITLKDGLSKLFLIRLSEDRLKWQVEMSEGRNRQIRRTFGALGYSVEKLQRIEFGKYKLGNLKVGDFIEVKD